MIRPMSTYSSNPHHMSDKPRRVRGGVRLLRREYPLRLSRAAGGWMDAVAKLAREQELKEGFDYARAGQARELAVEPGHCVALIQGRALRPYKVILQCRTFDDAQWDGVIRALSHSPLVAGRLLAGEWHDDLLAFFASAGLDLIPPAADLIAACSAPNERPWCKHACCVALLVAEAIEKEPLRLLTLRGMPASELIERLRDAHASVVAGARAAIELDAGLNESSPPLEAHLDDFWDAGPALAEIETPIRKPEVSHALLRRLGPSPFPDSRFPLVGLLATCYDIISREALKERHDPP